MNFTIDTTITMGVIVTVLLAVIAWVQASRSSLLQRLGQHESRIASVEQTLRSMPGADDLHQLRLSISDMKGEFREVRATMQVTAEIQRRQEQVLTRVEEFLLREKV